VISNSLKLLRKLSDQQQYFELRDLSQSVWHETQAKELAILPGMTAQVDIRTGDR